MKRNLRTFAEKFLSLFLVMTILAPFPFVLAIPQYAFAEPNTPATYGGASGSGATASGGSTNSWGQQAASGAVSLSSCMAAAGITLGGAAAASAVGAAIGGALSGAGSYLSGVFSGIFGSSASGAVSSLSGSAGLTSGFFTDGASAGASAGAEAGASAGAEAGASAGSSAAELALAVPVTDTGAKLQRTLIAIEAGLQRSAQIAELASIVKIQLGIATKKNVFDCIAWAIAKMIWRSIAASVIDWINGGFNGKPAFIQNFDRFLLGIADNIAGEIIQGAGLGFLCSPFQLSIRIALATRYSQRGAPQCTLTQVIANVQNFMKNFSKGGWGAWIQFTSAPQNNPFGGYLLGEATISLRTQDAKSQQSQQLSWGSGFLSLTQQTCKQVPVSISVEGGKTLAPQMTQKCTSTIQTPGELIAHKLGSTVDAPELSLLMADELNQIIDALSQQLILKALNGLFSLSQPTSYGDDYYRFSTPTAELSGQDTGSGPINFVDDASYSTSTPIVGNMPGSETLIRQIESSIDNESKMQERLGEALNVINASIQNSKTIKTCWHSKASATSTAPLSQTDRTQASIQSQGQTFSLLSLENRKEPFADGLTQSRLVSSSLQTTIANAANARTTLELAEVSQDFYTKAASGVYTTADTLNKMDEVLVKLRKESTTLYENALLDMNICRYFPNPVPAQ